MAIQLGEGRLSRSEVIAVARENAQVDLSDLDSVASLAVEL